MKPRLDCLPLSAEDTDIWHLVVDRFYGLSDCSRYAFVGLWTRSLTQGRRDADLMYKLQLAFCLFEDFDQAEIWSACFRADILRGDWKRVEFVSGLDITNCA